MDRTDFLRGECYDIPLWRGASAICFKGNTRTITHVNPYSGELECAELSGTWEVGDLTLDLENPETRAGYLYRLAVALGCPEAVAALGVTFQPSQDGWELAAGRRITPEGSTYTPWLWHSGTVPRFATADELVAMARAWPGDKRVQPSQ